MGIAERPNPLTPEAQVAQWRAEGHALPALLARVRTPAIRAVIQAQLDAQALDAHTPKTTSSVVVTGGG